MGEHVDEEPGLPRHAVRRRADRPDTVNTLPDATIEAFADHGTLARRVDADVDEAEAVWQGLADVGVDMDDVAATLEREGVASFEKSFDELLATLEAKSAELTGD